MTRENPNLTCFGAQSKKIDIEKNANGNMVKKKLIDANFCCQNSIEKYMKVSGENAAKNFEISLENKREIPFDKVSQTECEDAKSQDQVILMRNLIKKNKKYVQKKQKEASSKKNLQDKKALMNHCIIEERVKQDEEKLERNQISADTIQKKSVPIREIGVNFFELRNSNQNIKVSNSNENKEKIKSNNNNIKDNKIIDNPYENTKTNLSNKTIRENDHGINTLIIPPSINHGINTLINTSDEIQLAKDKVNGSISNKDNTNNLVDNNNQNDNKPFQLPEIFESDKSMKKIQQIEEDKEYFDSSGNLQRRKVRSKMRNSIAFNQFLVKLLIML